jgi:hypothetical protein
LEAEIAKSFFTDINFMFYVQTYYSADCLKKRYEMGPESPTQVLDSLKAEYLVKLKTETLAAVLSEVKNETPN